MENTCSIGKIIQLKCYAGKYRSFYKFDIEDLSLQEVELIRVRAKVNSFDSIIDDCTRKLKYSIFLTSMLFSCCLC